MKLMDVSIAEACPTLKYSFRLYVSDPNETRHILIIKFVGHYREGSAGNPDSELMAGILQIGVGLWQPKAVIVDLSDLTYNWGDQIEWAYHAPGVSEIAVVVGPNCRRALSTLEFGMDTQKDITEVENFFDSLEAAIHYTEHLFS